MRSAATITSFFLFLFLFLVSSVFFLLILYFHFPTPPIRPYITLTNQTSVSIRRHRCSAEWRRRRSSASTVFRLFFLFINRYTWYEGDGLSLVRHGLFWKKVPWLLFHMDYSMIEFKIFNWSELCRSQRIKLLTIYAYDNFAIVAFGKLYCNFSSSFGRICFHVRSISNSAQI